MLSNVITLWIDLTLPVYNGSPVFPGQPSPIFFPWTTLDLHPNATTAFFMVEHTGTHLDVPSHFNKNGLSVEEIPVDRFCGRCRTIDISHFQPEKNLSKDELLRVVSQQRIDILPDDIILFCTKDNIRYGNEDYFRQYAGLSREAAQYLVDQKIKGVGIDAPSIDHEPYDSHRVFLPAGVIIYEFLTNLEHLLKKEAFFYGFPLKFNKCTGSPIRAVAQVKMVKIGK